MKAIVKNDEFIEIPPSIIVLSDYVMNIKPTDNPMSAIDETNLLEFIGAYISIRVIVLQLFPYGSIASVISSDLASCPLFVLSQKPNSKFTIAQHGCIQ